MEKKKRGRPKTRPDPDPKTPKRKRGGQPGNTNNLLGRGKIPMNFLAPKEINFDQILYWINLQATAEEIAGSFRITTETLDRQLKSYFGFGFMELRKLVDGEGKLSLRRYQFQQAEKNASMAIWLGKQWLGQKDNEKTIVYTNPLQEIVEQIDNSSKDLVNGNGSIANRGSESAECPEGPALEDQQPIQDS